MNIEEFRLYCLSKPKTEECLPFDDTTLVFKVSGKMFALTSLFGDGFKVNLKCDPDEAIKLREEHQEVEPGYHMSKKHWNTVDFNGELTNQQLKSFIDDSFDLVLKGLPKTKREEVKKLLEKDKK